MIHLLRESHLSKAICAEDSSSLTKKFTIWPQVLHSCHIKLLTLLLVIVENYTKK